METFKRWLVCAFWLMACDCQVVVFIMILPCTSICWLNLTTVMTGHVCLLLTKPLYVIKVWQWKNKYLFQ